MDITQLIADDHVEQRRLFALIDERAVRRSGCIERSLVAAAHSARTRHALAEERFFYPELLKLWRGADSRSPAEETRDAIKDR